MKIKSAYSWRPRWISSAVTVIIIPPCPSPPRFTTENIHSKSTLTHKTTVTCNVPAGKFWIVPNASHISAENQPYQSHTGLLSSATAFIRNVRSVTQPAGRYPLMPLCQPESAEQVSTSHFVPCTGLSHRHQSPPSTHLLTCMSLWGHPITQCPPYN